MGGSLDTTSKLYQRKMRTQAESSRASVVRAGCIGGIDRQYCGLKWSREQKIGQLGLIMLDNDVLDW